jgi:hypothetical protein
MFSPLRRGAGLLSLALALAAWIVPGSSAFARGGGGGHGGGGHGGGGHGGGHHSGGHHSGGFHFGGHHGGRYYYGGYPGYGYGYGYSYPYYNYGYGYPYYTYSYPGYTYSNPLPVAPGSTAVGSAGDAAPAQGRYLGIDEVAVVDSGGQGMRVMRVYPGTPAEKAGLQVGDVILSANGYLTQQHGHLAWIIANAGPDGVLQLNVRTARDGAEHVISARVP